MNKQTILILAVLLSSKLLLSQNPDFASWKSFEKDNYAIQYPGEWELDDSGKLGPSFFVSSPLSNQEDKFRENVNLMVEDLNGIDLDLQQYVAFSIEQIKAHIKDCKIISNETMGVKAHHQKLVYTGQVGVFDLKFVQYFWTSKEKGYVLTFTSEETQFEKYQKMGLQMLDSFEMR